MPLQIPYSWLPFRALGTSIPTTKCLSNPTLIRNTHIILQSTRMIYTLEACTSKISCVSVQNARLCRIRIALVLLATVKLSKMSEFQCGLIICWVTVLQLARQTHGQGVQVQISIRVRQINELHYGTRYSHICPFT